MSVYISFFVQVQASVWQGFIPAYDAFEFNFFVIAVSYRRGRRRGGPPKREPKQRTNQRIRAEEVRVVDEQGEMLGVMPIAQALSKAEEAGVDLVEISPKAKPPVCKIIDFGKFLYNEQKKEKAQKKATKSHEIKGIRLSFRIGPGDMERQRGKAEEFLTDQHPVRVQMVMRGREKAHKHLAIEKMNAFLDTLKEFGIVEQPAKFSGFQIVAVLKPVGKGWYRSNCRSDYRIKWRMNLFALSFLFCCSDVPMFRYLSLTTFWECLDSAGNSLKTMKQKTHSGVKKRTRVTGSGKIMFQRSCKNHLLSSKNKKALKADRGGKVAPAGHLKTLSRLLKIGR